MRLRRLEIIVIGLTLAFAIFMGGFFTGRNWSAVNIVSASAKNEDTIRSNVVSQSPGGAQRDAPDSTAGSRSGDNAFLQPEDPAQNQINNDHSETQNDSAGTPGDGLPRDGLPREGFPRGGDGRININLASQSELTDLPGIGSVLASRIIDYRRQHGDFQRIEDIRNVSGIGEKRYEAIQDKITVG